MKVAYSRKRLEARIAQMGRAISRDYAGRTVDVVAVLENSLLFAADLVRHISRPVVCHFVTAEMRNVRLGGYERREVFFSRPPSLAGRDVLLVDTVIFTGVTHDFLMRRLEECRPRSLRLAVLLNKSHGRKVDLQPEYSGFDCASKYWVGFGLASLRGLYRNLPFVGTSDGTGRRRRGRSSMKSKG